MRSSGMLPGGEHVLTGMQDRVVNAALRAGDALPIASDSTPAGFRSPRGTSLYMGFDDPKPAR